MRLMSTKHSDLSKCLLNQHKKIITLFVEATIYKTRHYTLLCILRNKLVLFLITLFIKHSLVN